MEQWTGDNLHVTCDHACELQGWWTEKDARGNPVFCFKVRHHGGWHVIRLTEAQFERLMRRERGRK